MNLLVNLLVNLLMNLLVKLLVKLLVNLLVSVRHTLLITGVSIVASTSEKLHSLLT